MAELMKIFITAKNTNSKPTTAINIITFDKDLTANNKLSDCSFFNQSSDFINNSLKNLTPNNLIGLSNNQTSIFSIASPLPCNKEAANLTESNDEEDRDYPTNETAEKLLDQIHRIQTELFYHKDKNHLLRREMAIVSTVAKREIAGNAENLEEIFKKAVDGEWMGRQELIVALKKKIKELVDTISQKKDNFDPNFIADTKSTKECSETTKRYWRLELEKRSIARNLEREKRKRLNEKKRLEEEILYFRNINENLIEERESFELEISRMPSDDNPVLIPQMQEMETRIKQCFHSKSHYVKMVAKEEKISQQYMDTIFRLKSEIDIQKDKLMDAENRLEILKLKDESLKQAIEERKTIIVERFWEIRKITEHLNNLYNQQIKNITTIEDIPLSSSDTSMQPENFSKAIKKPEIVPFNKNQSLSQYHQLQRNNNQTTYEEFKGQRKNRGKSIVSNNSKQIISKDANHPLRINISKLKLMYEENDEVNLNRYAKLSEFLDKIKNNVKNAQENKSNLTKAIVSNRILKLKLKLLRKTSTGEHENTADQNCISFSKLLESNQLLLDTLKNENKYLKHWINCVITNKEEDLDFYITGMGETGDYFLSALQSLIKKS